MRPARIRQFTGPPIALELLEQQPQIFLCVRPQHGSGLDDRVERGVNLHVADLVVYRDAAAAASRDDILELRIGVEQHRLHSDRRLTELARWTQHQARLRTGDPNPPDVVQSLHHALVERDPRAVETRADGDPAAVGPLHDTRVAPLERDRANEPGLARPADRRVLDDFVRRAPVEDAEVGLGEADVGGRLAPLAERAESVAGEVGVV